MAKSTSSWFVTLISIERGIVVWFPLKAKSIITSKRICFSVALVYICLGTFNAIWGYFTDFILDGVCQVNKTSDANRYLEQLFAMLGSCVMLIIPAIIISTLNALTIYKVTKQSRFRKEVQTTYKDDETRKITGMLICVSVAFVILAVPITIAHTYVSYTGYTDLFSSKELSKVIIRKITQTMEQLNYSINYFLYVMCSAAFRKEVMAILCGGKIRLTRSKYSKDISTISTSN